MVNQASVLAHYVHKACETQTQSAVLISASGTVSSTYWKSCQNGLPETVARTSTLFDRVDNYRQRWTQAAESITQLLSSHQRPFL